MLHIHRETVAPSSETSGHMKGLSMQLLLESADILGAIKTERL